MARSERGDADDAGATGVMLLVCLECGREVQFESGDEPPPELKCEKCGNEVFRRFDDTESPDDAQSDFRDTTERDTAPTDAEGEATRQDLLDLNNP